MLPPALNAEPAPVITSLIPTQIAAGSPGFTLGVNGYNFAPDFVFGSGTLTGSRVQWNRQGTETIVTLPTTYGSPTKLAARTASPPRSGQKAMVRSPSPPFPAGSSVALMDSAGHLVGVGETGPGPGWEGGAAIAAGARAGG